MSEDKKKSDSKLSLSAKADKFDVPLSTLKKVYKRGVAAWNSGHRPGTTPQQWGHARVNSFLRKGKTYHTADKDLREDTEQLNELKKETMQSYLEKRPSVKIKDVIAARAAERAGDESPINRLAKIQQGRRRAQKKINKIDTQAAVAERQRKIASGEITADDLEREHLNLHHPYAPRVPGVPDKPGSRYWGDHVEHNADINKLFEDHVNEGVMQDVRQLFSLDPQKKQSGALTAVETGLGFIPGVGQALAARDLERARRARDPAAAAMAAASMIPGGRLVNVAGKARQIFVPASKEGAEALKALERAGKSREEIWAATRNAPGGSVFRNPQTGEIKQEISDAGLRLRPELQGKRFTATGSAQQIIQHDDLFKQYPDIARYRTQTTVTSPKKQTAGLVKKGEFDPGKKSVMARGESEADVLDTFTHELQHAVQHKTGASSGSSIAYEKKQLGIFDKMFGDIEKKSLEKYYANPGEVEARAAAARRTLSATQRQERYPWLDYATSSSKSKPAAAATPITPPKPVVAAPKPVAVAPKPVVAAPKPVVAAPKPAPLPKKAAPYQQATPSTPPKPVRLTAESIEDLNEMQLVGTDEYRQHAIAMTPGQDQEIEDVFPPEVYGAAVPQSSMEQEETKTTEETESNNESGSENNGTDGTSFRKIRKQLQEQPVEEVEEEEIEDEEIEDEEEELEDDGAEDGVDFTPSLKTRKIKNMTGNEYATDSVSGFPVLGITEAVDYHYQNNISLVENVYRPGSEMFFAMLLEAKRLYAEGKYIPKDEYEQDLLESDIGEVAEYNGELVLLDYPYEDMEECWKGYTQKGMKKKGDKMVPNCVPVSEEKDPTRGKGIGKPFRSRGGGAVYVRNNKGNIIKVNFSQSGMRKRFNEPARVKSFVARHNCYGNKDKTSASYWACRWPRYFSDSGQQWW